MASRAHGKIRLAAVAVVAAGAALGLTGCNPAPGHAEIHVTGAVTADHQGPTVACPPPTSGVGTERWSGKMGGKAAMLSIYNGIEGDLDGIIFEIGGVGYNRLEHDMREVDAFGVVHIDQTLTANDGSNKKVRVVAALRCPKA